MEANNSRALGKKVKQRGVARSSETPTATKPGTPPTEFLNGKKKPNNEEGGRETSGGGPNQ